MSSPEETVSRPEETAANDSGNQKTRSNQRQRNAWTRIAWYMLTPTLLAMTIALFARLHWTLDLATHFVVQYALALLPPLVVGLCLRSKWVLGIGGAALIYNLVLIAPLYIPPGGEASRGEPLRFLLANVHTGNRDYPRLLELVNKRQPDVFVLLETDNAWVQALAPLRQDYPHSVERPRGDNFGIVVFSRRPLEDVQVMQLGESMVPTIVAKLRQDTDRQLTLIATHPLPPTTAEYANTRNQHLAALAELANETAGPLIVLGDLNTTSWSPHFADLIAETGLRDTRRGFGVHGTWPLPYSVLSIPLDHVLVSEDVAVLQRQVGPEIGSDHRPVTLDVAIPVRE